MQAGRAEDADAGLWELSLDMLATASPEGRLTRLNPAWEETLGYSREELMGKPYMSYVHPDDVQRTTVEASALLDPGHRTVCFENRYRASDGGYRWLAWNARSSHDGSLIHCVVRDVTKAKLAEAERDGLVARLRAREQKLRGEIEQHREAEERFMGAFENAPIGMALVALDDRLIRVNGALCALTGYSAAELIGKTLRELTEPEDRAAASEADRQLQAGAIERYRQDRRLLHSRGHTIWVDASGSIIRDGRGQPVHRIVQLQDISERREVERVKHEFASVVSHELRTPVTSIQGSLGLLQSGVLGVLPRQGQLLVEIALANTERLVRLINDILDIERINSGEIDMRPASCDARALIERAVEAVAALAAAADVSVLLDAEPLRLSADPVRLVQALASLLDNAVKFSPPGGRVRVSCASRGGEALFEVSDEGRGVPAEQLQSIFGCFAQVDASDSRRHGGTGLGLAICRSIVEQHGGRIWARSVLGEGATFSFTLPAPTLDGTAARLP